MAVMTAYFDASGAPGDQKFVVVSGFVANYLQWGVFENAWSTIHKEFGVEPPFHMTEFMARAGSKPGNSYFLWADEVHNQVASEFRTRLGNIMQLLCLVNLCCIVPMEIYRDISTLFPLEEAFPAYAVGARVCVEALRSWQVQHGLTYMNIELIFEKGDLGQGEFKTLMTLEGMEIPIYKSKKDFAGLQAADLMAWEQSSFVKRELRGKNIPLPNFNWLLNIPHVNLEVTREMLLNLCRVKGIDPRTGIRS